MIKPLRIIVIDSNTKGGRRFDIFIQFCIVLSLISFSIEVINDLPAYIRNFLKYIEVITVVIFSIEYLLRVFLSHKKIKYVLSFYGIIDLIAILPFYLSLGIDLRSVRIFRLLRLFRILKLAGYSNAVDTFVSSFNHIKKELTVFGVFSIIILYISSLGIYLLEKDVQPDNFGTIIDSFWWSIFTLTSIGYGDIYPITNAGKLLTSIIAIIGLGIVAVPTGLFASALLKTVRDK